MSKFKVGDKVSRKQVDTGSFPPVGTDGIVVGVDSLAYRVMYPGNQIPQINTERELEPVLDVIKPGDRVYSVGHGWGVAVTSTTGTIPEGSIEVKFDSGRFGWEMNDTLRREPDATFTNCLVVARKGENPFQLIGDGPSYRQIAKIDGYAIVPMEDYEEASIARVALLKIGLLYGNLSDLIETARAEMRAAAKESK